MSVDQKLEMDRHPAGYRLQVGDVVIRHSPNRAPSLYLVGGVTQDGQLPGSNTRLFTAKSEALDHAYKLLMPERMVLWVDDEGMFHQDTSKRPG